MDRTTRFEVDPEDMANRRAEGELVLVDIREPREREIVSLDDDYWIPMNELPNGVETFEELDEDIVLYCHHGARSLRMTRFLRDEGLEKVFSLSGGIDAWARRIEPGMARY